jgi:hypothetical protein
MATGTLYLWTTPINSIPSSKSSFWTCATSQEIEDFVASVSGIAANQDLAR